MENTQDAGTTSMKTLVRHTGGCHCGAVRFQVELELGFRGNRCNCTICQKLAPTAAIVQPAALSLLAGDESLSDYQWGAQISTRYFCKHCGVYCFAKGHLPELGGHFASVNLNCLDEFDVNAIEIAYWDGRHENWAAGTRSTPWPLFPKREPVTPELAHQHELARAS